MPIATTAKRLVILRVTDPDRLADAIDADLRPQTGIRRSAFAAVSSKLIRDPFDQLSDKVDDGPTKQPRSSAAADSLMLYHLSRRTAAQPQAAM